MFDLNECACGKSAVLEKEKNFKATRNPQRDHQVDLMLEEKLSEISLEKPLTKREKEILRHIVAGKTNKMIAKEIFRTERTVEYHRNHLMKKFNAHTAADLIKKAIKTGLI